MTISARYWRLNVTDTIHGAGGIVRVSGLELRATVGGANQATTGLGTASASSFLTYNADNAFDSNLSTNWYSNNPPAQWLQWDAGSAIDVDQVVLIQGNTAGQNARGGNIKYSYNGTDFFLWHSFTSISTVVNASIEFLYQPPPLLTLDGFIPLMTTDIGLGIDVTGTIPMVTLDAACGGGNETIGSIPMMTLAADFGAELNGSIPMMFIKAEGHDSTGENYIVGIVPTMTLEADFGIVVNSEIPAMTLEAEMTSVAIITVEVSIPMMTLEADGIGSPYIVTVDAVIPMAALEADFGTMLEGVLPAMMIEASITAGGLLTLDASIPMMVLDAQGTQQSYAWADLTIPMMIPLASITAELSIPMMVLDAQITAVVAVTYEAYAVNLTHKGVKDPVDEVTRYTNFPFERIVRYNNSYFGVAADGLYLLEGTTDHATQPTQIPWEFKTHLTDFENPKEKTVVSAYFGGRMGKAETITLYAGEKTTKAYKYKTTRGSTAQNHREKFGRGIKARYFAIGANGSDGMELDDIEFNIHTLTRRI